MPLSCIGHWACRTDVRCCWLGNSDWLLSCSWSQACRTSVRCCWMGNYQGPLSFVCSLTCEQGRQGSPSRMDNQPEHRILLDCQGLLSCSWSQACRTSVRCCLLDIASHEREPCEQISILTYNFHLKLIMYVTENEPFPASFCLFSFFSKII